MIDAFWPSRLRGAGARGIAGRTCDVLPSALAATRLTLQDTAMHRVVVVAFDGVVPFDLATPSEVFGRARLPNGRSAYQVRVAGVSREVDAGPFKIRVTHGLTELLKADTVILPGVADVTLPVPERLVRAVRKAARAGARVASICSGAFLLAATGLLDGCRATTHWLAASELARRFPRVEVDPNVLYVDAGQVLTSAGAAAGLDLCLHMIRRDYGAAVASEAARIAVMPLERDGGQAQFIVQAPPVAEGTSLATVLAWLEENLHEEIALRDIARHAATSVRSLSRHFKEQTGTTPLQWLLRARVRRAQLLLETTPSSVERVAANAGFGSVASFREQFHRVVGTSPQSYRRAFRTSVDRHPR
jgi:transcriptional regulator GlxA family with amidase domain